MIGPRKPAEMPDVVGALLSIEQGVYAVTQIARHEFDDGIDADAARAGILYVSLKLQRDLRALIEPLCSMDRGQNTAVQDVAGRSER